MDVMSALAVANTAIATVRKIAKTSQNARHGVSEVYRELGKYAEAVETVREWCGNERKPTIFQKITFKKSATSEALSELAVRERIKNLEKELKHEFYWNSLSFLGADGYKQFISIRRSIQHKRLKLKQEQIERRKSFIRNSALGSVLVVMFVVLFYMVNLIFQAAKG